MTREIEYNGAMTNMLELIWGVGFMTPGGEGNIANMIEGLETQDRRILDIGCGIGGPAFVLASQYGADVVGVDIEPQLIEQARIRADKLKMGYKCEFVQVDPGPLPFPDESFDIVFSAGVVMTIDDKQQVFAEALRVLKPGGIFTVYDWMKNEGDYSEDMLYWFKMEEITYALETLADYDRHLNACGFVDVKVEDASDWYRRQANHEFELIKGELYPRMVELLGQQSADHFVENWRSMVVVCDKGEMRQGYCRGRRPLSA